MRRTDKELAERAAMDAVIHGSLVCRLAMVREGGPYLVPVSFGYDGEAIYFHTAPEGMKIRCFEADPNVCFEFERGVEVRPDPVTACRWTLAYESVVGFGVVREIADPEGRAGALNEIMRHYSGREWDFEEASLKRVRIWRIEIRSMTGKRSPAKPS